MKISNKLKSKISVFLLTLSIICGSIITTDAATLTINSTSEGKILSNAEFKIKNVNNNFYIAFNESNNGNYTYSNNGSTQAIKTNENGELNIGELPAGKYYIEPTSNNILNSQTQLINISNDSVQGQATMNFEKSNGSVSLKLTDSDGKSISNSTFTISNSSGLIKFNKDSDGNYTYNVNGSTSNIKTNSNGKFYLSSLPNGNYVVEQKDTANGYKSLYSSDIYVDGPISLSAINYKDGNSNSENKSSGDLLINVKDEKDNPLSNIVFKVTNNSGESKELTVSNGSVKQYFSEGEYNIEEIKSLDGYDKLSKKSFSIKKNETTTISIKKKHSTGSLEIIKNDSETKKGIKDFVFTLSNSSGDLSFKEDKGKYYYDKDGTIKELKTDSLGKIDIQKIPSGNIKITEKSGPSGYRLIAGSVEKNIIPNNKTNYTSSSEKIRNVLYIKDKESKDDLKGVSYRIKDQQNTLIKEGVSDGSPITGLSGDGDYYIQIVSVPERYSLPNEEIHVNMSSNKLNKQDINIEQATISASVGSNMQGEEFTLYKDGSKFEVKSTDINGIVDFKNLGYGEYVIKQTGSSGKVSMKEYTVTIDKNYSNSKEPFKFFNEKKDIKKTKKKISKKTIILLGLFIVLCTLLGLAGYYYYLSKKINNDEIKLIEGPVATEEELKKFQEENKTIIDKIKSIFNKKVGDNNDDGE